MLVTIPPSAASIAACTFYERIFEDSARFIGELSQIRRVSKRCNAVFIPIKKEDDGSPSKNQNRVSTACRCAWIDTLVFLRSLQTERGCLPEGISSRGCFYSSPRTNQWLISNPSYACARAFRTCRFWSRLPSRSAYTRTRLLYTKVIVSSVHRTRWRRRLRSP